MENNQEQLTPQPVPSEPSQAPPPSPKPALLKWLLIVFLFSLAVFGGVLYVQNTNKSQISTVVPTQIPQTSPSPTPDVTANWKTYITMTFSFQYPSNYTVMKVNYDSYFVSNESNSPPIKINQQQDYVGETFDQKIEASKSGLKNVKVKKTDYGVLITGTLPIMDGIPTAIALVRDKDNAIDITQETNEYELDVFHKIIATIKLIEPKQTQISNNDLAIIQQALAQKDHVDITKVHISQDQYVGPAEFLGKYALGHYNTVWGNGKSWYAKKNNGRWSLMHVGNGLPLCTDIDHFNAPREILPCISDTGSE